MKKTIQIALYILTLAASGNLAAQCAPGSPCALRSGGNYYNSERERPYGAPDYSQFEQEMESSQNVKSAPPAARAVGTGAAQQK